MVVHLILTELVDRFDVFGPEVITGGSESGCTVRDPWVISTAGEPSLKMKLLKTNAVDWPKLALELTEKRILIKIPEPESAVVPPNPICTRPEIIFTVGVPHRLLNVPSDFTSRAVIRLGSYIRFKSKEKILSPVRSDTWIGTSISRPGGEVSTGTDT